MFHVKHLIGLREKKAYEKRLRYANSPSVYRGGAPEGRGRSKRSAENKRIYQYATRKIQVQYQSLQSPCSSS